MSGEFGQKLNSSVVDSEGTWYFKLGNQGQCPFLNKESLCDIYINLGEEHLCTTCKIYPRKNWTYGDITFVGKYISCPEVARILFESQGSLSFGFTEDSLACDENTDWDKFNLFIRGMTISIEILQNQELDFKVRMRAVLMFNYYFEEHLKEGTDCSELFEIFSNVDSILIITDKINRLNTNYSARVALFIAIAQDISKITDANPIIGYIALGGDILQKSGNVEQLWNNENNWGDDFDISHIYEQYSVYYVFMYYMNYFQKMQPFKFMIQFFTTFYLQNCFEAFMYNKNMEHLTLSDMIEIYTRTARTYEHSSENKNMETTFSILEKNKMDSLSFLLSLI